MSKGSQKQSVNSDLQPNNFRNSQIANRESPGLQNNSGLPYNDVKSNAIKWLQDNFEVGEDAFLKKDVYQCYKLYCEQQFIKLASKTHFGVLVNSVFPVVKTTQPGSRFALFYNFPV